jgi:hypothetical protein
MWGGGCVEVRMNRGAGMSVGWGCAQARGGAQVDEDACKCRGARVDEDARKCGDAREQGAEGGA